MKIGWLTHNSLFGRNGMASSRLRTYDIIRSLKKEGIKCSLYKPFMKYDIVIFQKRFDDKAIKIARKLRKRNTKIIFDINVNYIDSDESFVLKSQQLQIREMLDLSDVVLTSSEFLKDLYKKFNDNVNYIPEIIEDSFFQNKKKHDNDHPLNLIYCGYATKANELELICNELNQLKINNNFSLLLVCEKDPKIDFFPYTFSPYNQDTIAKDLLRGDIKIAARDITRPYNLGHSFTKIGYPMSVGLPVVASPVPSYLNSPAFICHKPEDWMNHLQSLLQDASLRQKSGDLGIQYCRSFSSHTILPQYLKLFQNL